MHVHPKVLVVDDESSIRRQLHLGLAQHGYQVEECESALPALARLGTSRSLKSPFGVVVLDVRLPDIDGLKALSVIRATYPDLPVVVITGYGNEDTVNEVASHGECGYLDKPFDIETLLHELDRIVARPAERHQVTAAFEPGVLSSAQVFIRGSHDADLPDMYSRLAFAEGVCYCDAVLGDWDLVVLMQARDLKELEQLVRQNVASLEGVKAFEVHPSERPRLSAGLEEFIQDYEKARALRDSEDGEGDLRQATRYSCYAVLDVDAPRLPDLYPKLYFTENVLHCDVTDGGRQIILLMQGVSAQEVQATIRNEIRLMPGVLRIRQLTIMNFAVK